MKYYIGLSLAATSSVDTGVAIIDEFNNIIFVDKLYRMNDIIYFFDNYSSPDSELIALFNAFFSSSPRFIYDSPFIISFTYV